MSKSRLLGAICMFIVSISANAAITAYTDETSFLAALSGSASTLDFNNTSAGTLIPSGNSLGGVTFTYSISALNMKVVNDFDTTSLNNYLGLDDAGNYDLFLAGDEFSIAFSSPTNAVGMYFVSGDPLLAGDVSLVTSSGTATNSAIVNVTLPDGGLAYYVGLTSAEEFSSATVQFASGAVETFLYSVDDITISILPMPSWLQVNGTANGGAVYFSVAGVALSVTTTNGLNPEEVIQAMVDAVNDDPTLSSLSITALAGDDVMYVNGEFTGITLTDSGLILTHGFGEALRADGDINLDGEVNVADILLGLQVLNDTATLSPEQFIHGDVAPLVGGVPDPDGLFTLGDLLVIERKVLGVINF